MVFFFVLGLLLIKGPMRWWIILSSMLSIMLAWGSNFPALSYFFLDHVPFYNKFRTVEMTLVIVCFNIPLMAFLMVDRILKEPGLFIRAQETGAAGIRTDRRAFPALFPFPGPIFILFVAGTTNFQPAARQGRSAVCLAIQTIHERTGAGKDLIFSGTMPCEALC